jgi:hypothetical protein
MRHVALASWNVPCNAGFAEFKKAQALLRSPLKYPMIRNRDDPEFRRWVYALGVGAAAFSLCARLARPEGAPGALPFVLGVPFLVLGAIALVELAGVPAGERRGLWLGQTALTCPWLIAALAIPIFVAALWALRSLAPTRQRLAGFSAGCLAGAAAAVLYALHCNENAAAFVVSWYTVGILVPGLVGILIGPRVLHW